ncbi:MAG TPA: efflux RND transporter periplasmic adaptor subunit [Acidobacteriota bacterium]|nr:efflux RND transporter periplasmic adaptor subunit [Acidobacteriota bacterium]
MKKGIWWLIIVVAAAAGGWWWYSSGQSEAVDEGMLARKAVARRGDLLVSITATGRVDPIESVEVKSKASGEIITLPIEEGDFVKRGDLIARLDRTTAQNDFDQADADLAVAEATVQQREREKRRVEALVNQNLSPADDLDQALLAYEQANAQLVRARSTLSTARERLDDTEIRAPIDGVVLSRPVEIGQVISSGMTTVTGGTLLCTVANLSKVYVVASVDETDIGKVADDLTAAIVPDAYPDLRLEGTVLRIAPLAKVEQNVTVFEVTVLVENSDYLLKAGMNATVEVVISKAENAILIPARAVQMHEVEPRSRVGAPDSTGLPPAMAQRNSESEGGPGEAMAANREHGGPGGEGDQPRMRPAVQVIRDGATEWQPIRVGLSNFDDVEVIRGLAEGDTVVYNLTSGAMQARADFRERMRERSSVPGMRTSR